MKKLLPEFLVRRSQSATPLIALIVGWVALAVAPSASGFSPDTWTPGAGWNLVWADEFNGTSIMATNWTYDTGGGGWGNKELESYTADPANSSIQHSIQNGADVGELVIKAVKSRGKYTSARLKTQGKQSWRYGKVAARIRLPYGQGIWPAFWMLGTNITTVGWPKSGEIDIMEMIGGGEDRDDSTYGTLHYDANGSHASVGSGRKELPDPQFFYQDYHVFEIEWNNSEVIWKRDGTEFFRASVSPSLDREEFQQPFFIILNLAVGGSWPGFPNGTTVFPQAMYVDWVRVYQPQ